MTIDQALARAKKAARQGNVALATRLFEAVLAQQPGHPVAKKNLRKLARQTQRRGPTVAAAPQPTREEIDGIVRELHLGRLTIAERACSALLERFPGSAVALNLLGVVLQRQGEYAAAVDTLAEAVRAVPDFAEAHDNLGIALKQTGDIDGALRSFDEAISLRPDFAEAHYNRANALKEFGHMQEAADGYAAAIRIRPGFAEAHRNLSSIKRFEPGDEQLEQIEGLLDTDAAAVTSPTELWFAAAKAYEDLGDAERSFAALQAGNALRAQQQPCDPASDERLFATVRQAFTADLAPGVLTSGDTASCAPVFVVGMMRSGTSLVEQILSSHPAVHGAGELETMNRLIVPLLPTLETRLASGDTPALAEDETARIRTGYLAELGDIEPRADFVTDKMPLNFRWVGFILTALPEAKVIHLVRDPVATCWSIYKNYFPDAGHNYAYSLETIAQYFRHYRNLMAFWHDRFPGRILDVRYEALTENQEAETRRLLDYCGLPWDDRCLEFHATVRPVRTLSSAQVRQKMYQGSSEAWRRYERQLEPLVRALE